MTSGPSRKHEHAQHYNATSSETTYNLGPESEWVEHKRSTAELSKGIASLAAMLNKHGEATLYFGVADNGDVIGQPVSKGTVKDVRAAISSTVDPKVEPVIEVLPVDDGKSFVKVSAHGEDKPYAHKGVYRIRIGEEDVLMDQEEVAFLQVQRFFSRTPWDSHRSNRTSDDVDERAVRMFVEKGRASGRIGFDYSDAREALERLGLVCEDGHLRNAGVVLFCPSESQEWSRLRMATYVGPERLDGFDLQSSNAPLLDLVDEAEYYIRRKITSYSDYSQGWARVDTPQIPSMVLRESLFNAFTHRDWTNPGGYVQIDVFPGQVVIENPGWFLPNQDPAAHLAGTNVSADSRNQLLAMLVFRSGEVERSGYGIPMMKRLCDEVGVGIVYERGAHTTRLRLLLDDGWRRAPDGKVRGEVVHANVDDDDPGVRKGDPEAWVAMLKEGKNPIDVMDEDPVALEVQRIICENPRATTSEMAKTIGVSRTKIQAVINDLKGRGFIERIGGRRYGTWVLI